MIKSGLAPVGFTKQFLKIYAHARTMMKSQCNHLLLLLLLLHVMLLQLLFFVHQIWNPCYLNCLWAIHGLCYLRRIGRNMCKATVLLSCQAKVSLVQYILLWFPMIKLLVICALQTRLKKNLVIEFHWSLEFVTFVDYQYQRWGGEV